VPVDIVLVRHAQPFVPTPGGPDEYHRSLTEDGLAAAERLVELLAEPVPAAIVSSPYLRAVQTVAPLARALGLPIHTDHTLREWDHGLEPTPDYARHFAASWADPAFARPGGESLQAPTDRAVAALTAVAHEYPGRTVVVGSHGTFIAQALVGFEWADVDWSFARNMSMPAIYRVLVGV